MPLLDYQLAKWFGRPFFSRFLGNWKDGGSKEYAGIGYRLVCHYRRVISNPPKREVGVSLDHRFLPYHFKTTQIVMVPGDKPILLKTVSPNQPDRSP
jgi:hypothetical protein